MLPPHPTQATHEHHAMPRNATSHHITLQNRHATTTRFNRRWTTSRRPSVRAGSREHAQGTGRTSRYSKWTCVGGVG